MGKDTAKICTCCEEKQAERDDGLCNSCAVYVYDQFQSDDHDFSWDSGADDCERNF